MAFVAAATMLSIGVLGLLVAQLWGLDRPARSAFVLAVTFSNAGNYGLGVTRLAFGEAAESRAVIYFVSSSILVYTLGTLIASGVPILQALNIVRETAGNAVVANAVAMIHDSVKEGERIVQPMEASKVFPPMVVSMVDVGEETGALPDMLTKIADVYDDEVDNAVGALTSMIEPIMIVFLAVMVGTIVIALFLPLIELMNKLGG